MIISWEKGMELVFCLVKQVSIFC